MRPCQLLAKLRTVSEKQKPKGGHENDHYSGLGKVMKITTISEGLARVATNCGNVIVSRDFVGRWTARPEWEILTVGKSFPRFSTRSEAVQWAIDTYGDKRK